MFFLEVDVMDSHEADQGSDCHCKDTSKLAARAGLSFSEAMHPCTIMDEAIQVCICLLGMSL